MAYTTIDKPTDYFNTKLYTGNGSTQSITGVGFQPDWTWIKSRSEAVAHVVFDSVRTAGGNKELTPNEQYQEGGNSTINYGFLSSFNSDGFSVSQGTSSPNQADYVNKSSQTYASWNWLASNSTASNTDGSITSTVSANTTSGFSIVSYTGTGSNATIGHGLNSVPSIIIAKDRDNTGGSNWEFYHASLGATNRIALNLTNASSSSSTAWVTTPTSSVFTIGTATNVNNSGNDFIAYCFAEKKGFSKAFSFTGNGSSDGSYCHLGFKPSFILGKNANNGSENWFIFDNKRDTYNTAYHQLFPNVNNAEGTNSSQNIDILSNGFKCRSAEARFNGSGNQIIGIAFAESPFVTSTGIPTTAR